MQEQAASTQSRSTRTARFLNYFHRYKNLLRRRWWVLPITLAIGLGIQGYRILKAPPTYVSVGRMMVSIKLQIQTGSVYTEEISRFLDTQVALMKSVTVMNRATDRVRALKPNLPAVPVGLAISILPKTTIFNFQVIAPEPEYAQAYLDACIEEYTNLKKEMRATTSETTLEGITEQLVTLERELKKDEEELINFQASNSVVVLQEQGNSAGNYLAQLNRQLADRRREFNLLTALNLDQNLDRQQRKDTLPVAADDKSPDSGQISFLSPEYQKAKQEIQLKKAELQEWSEFYKPKHPRMIALNEEITRREKLLEIFKQQSVEQLENRRNSLDLEIQTLEEDYKKWEAASLEVSKKMAAYDRLRANKQRVQDQYNRLLGAMQTLGVDKDINAESVTVLEKASPGLPARGNPAKALIIAGVIGLLAGVGFLLLVDRFDDRPASFTDLQDSFDEPVLGQIPLQYTNAKPGDIQLIQPDDARHAFVESYRNLRSSLLYMATEGKRPRIILVTSAIPSDGKSMTTANLAITMALSGSRVLLVDADLRKGRLHNQFGLPSTQGLNEVLSQELPWDQTVQPTSVPTLSLLPRGSLSRNPGEMFLSQKMRDLLKELSAQFDYVIIDTAPVMAADDVTSLSPHVEGVIFVIRAAYTSARVARAALDLLYQREVNVLGLVFNGVEINASEYYYYKYKDYYAESRTA